MTDKWDMIRAFKVNANQLELSGASICVEDSLESGIDVVLRFKDGSAIGVKDLLQRIEKLEEAYIELILLGRKDEKININTGNNS